MVQTLFAVLVAFLALSQASVLVLEEGTANEDDWRQLTIELTPGYFDNNGDLNFDKPAWTRREGDDVSVFYVLGSLICPEDSDQSVAARIGGEWICVDIDDERLPPTTEKRNANKRATEGRVDPPTCFEDKATAVWVTTGVYECGDPEGLIQAVTNPERPECFDRDLVVYNEDEDWFECQRLNTIQFASTISTDDFRWQTPSTTRHIGSLAATGFVRSGQYNNYKWTNYAFTASNDDTARDQTSPPEVVNSGGAFWAAYIISTTFVAISGSPPYETFDFYPIYPSAEVSYLEFLEDQASGTSIRGTELTFQGVLIDFNTNGVNSFTNVGSTFSYNGDSALMGYSIVDMGNEEIKAAQYPAVEIKSTVSNFFVGTSAGFNPNMIMTITMWLQYVNPSGF